MTKWLNDWLQLCSKAPEGPINPINLKNGSLLQQQLNSCDIGAGWDFNNGWVQAKIQDRNLIISAHLEILGGASNFHACLFTSPNAGT